MENYDFKGIIVQGKKAVLGIQLPKPKGNNVYCIYKVYNLSIPRVNIILIHFKDFIGNDLSVSKPSNNIESFSIDLAQVINISTDSCEINDAQEIFGLLIHDNNNDLKLQNEDFIKIINVIQAKKSLLETKQISSIGRVGRGTVKS